MSGYGIRTDRLTPYPHPFVLMQTSLRRPAATWGSCLDRCTVTGVRTNGGIAPRPAPEHKCAIAQKRWYGMRSKNFSSMLHHGMALRDVHGRLHCTTVPPEIELNCIWMDGTAYDNNTHLVNTMDETINSA